MPENKKQEATQDKPTQPDPVEVQKRSEAFLKDYGELTKKHNIDIAAYPVYQPDGEGGFKTIIQQSCVDTTNQPYRSPFMAKE